VHSGVRKIVKRIEYDIDGNVSQFHITTFIFLFFQAFRKSKAKTGEFRRSVANISNLKSTLFKPIVILNCLPFKLSFFKTITIKMPVY